MKRWILIAILLITVTSVALSVTQEEYPTVTIPAPKKTVSVSPPPNPKEILKLVNVERANAGVKQLDTNSQLNATATAKAKEMVTEDYYDHANPKTGKRGIDMIFAVLGARCYKASENLSATDTSQESVQGWMESPPHRLAMLDPKYEIVGAGVAKTEQYYYAVLHLCDTN